MKAKMTISSLSVPQERIQTVGGRLLSEPAGHHFFLSFRVKVKPLKIAGLKLSGDEIECPTLQWRERIEWFDFDTAAQEWRFVGENAKDLYVENPTSNTFKNWHSYRYIIATDPTNHPPDALKAMTSEEDAEKWIALNGFTWDLTIKDVPAMGLRGGSGGGAGASLVTGDTRRRVVYFDLGFSGHAKRVRLVQILETQNGQLTIHELIHGGAQKSTVDDPDFLERCRARLRTNQP
jgi:hypothetical protein